MEIEAKYKLSDEEAGLAVFHSQMVRQYCVGDGHTLQMESEYYQDPQGRLNAEGFTLRLRRENGRGVCCLKQDVRTEDAVWIRKELECPAETISGGVRGLLAAGGCVHGLLELFGCVGLERAQGVRVRFQSGSLLLRFLQLGIEFCLIFMAVL